MIDYLSGGFIQFCSALHEQPTGCCQATDKRTKHPMEKQSQLAHLRRQSTIKLLKKKQSTEAQYKLFARF